jgi:hypothetical protein
MVVIPNSLVLAAVDGGVTPTLVSLGNPVRGLVWSRSDVLDASQDLQNPAARVEIEI